MIITAATVAHEQVKWNIPEIPLVTYVDSRQAPPRGSVERARFVADLRNKAVEKALALYPKTESVLMIDSYYLDQTPQIRTLVAHYNGGEVLGASTWWIDQRTLVKKIKFWDTWVTPLMDGADFTASGRVKVSSVGGCYLFPRATWDKGVRYDIPEDWQVSEQVVFCRKSELPVYIDFDAKLFHPDPYRWSLKKRSLVTGKRIAIKIRDKVIREARRQSPYGFWTLYLPFQNLPMMHEAWLKAKVKLGQGGTTFVDVGANVGTWGLDASLFFDKVVEFEPDPRTMNILKKNFQLNDRLAVFQPYGLSDVDTQAVLRRYQTSGWNSVLERPLIQEARLKGKVPVTLRTLDSFGLQLDPKSLIKIDTEGAELAVLRGASKTLKQHPRVVIETHYEENIVACKQILADNGYTVEEVWIPGQSYLIAK